MKFEIEQSGLARAQVGKRLIALGKVLVGTGDAVLPLDGDQSALVVPDVPMTYELEVKVDETRGGKLEVEVKWPAVSDRRASEEAAQGSERVQDPDGG